jgi:hypothetical protein
MPIKYTQWLYSIVLKMTKYITTFSIQKPSKIYQNWNFWSEKKPSGNIDSKVLPHLEKKFLRSYILTFYSLVGTQSPLVLVFFTVVKKVKEYVF